METIERPSTVNAMDIFAEEPRPAERRPRRWPLRLWRETVAFFTIAGVALAVGGLTALRDATAAGWQRAYADFKWTVLVTGDRVEIDEIGRYLKQLDGVDNATFLPAAAIVDRLRREPLLENHLGVIEASQLPSIWELSWTPAFQADKIDETVADIRRLPGVVDVAFDSRALGQIRYFRSTWLSVRVLLAALAVGAVLLAALLFGRFLFFTRLSALRPARSVWIMAGALAAWTVGLAAAQGLVGPFSWHLAWAGFAAGAARAAIAHCRPVE